MILELLFSHPLLAIAWITAVIMAFTLHEFGHAWVAKLRGDRTAEREGRLTLNPIPHIDIWGLIPLLLFGFGWAKPVPFNPYNLKNPKWDSVLIALAGPAMNLLLAVVSGLILRGLLVSQVITQVNGLVVFLFFLVLLNLFLLFFNVLPVAPLDGSKLALALLDKPQHASIRNFMIVRGPQILLVLILVSIVFPAMNFFSFLSIPAYAVCDTLIGAGCQAFLGAILQ